MLVVALGFLAASPGGDHSLQPAGHGSGHHNQHSKKVEHSAKQLSKKPVHPEVHLSKKDAHPEKKVSQKHPMQPEVQAPHTTEAVDPVLYGISKANILPTHHTCTSKLPVTQACPAVAKNEGRVWDLDIPADARWLFYGPSFLGQAYATIIAANADQIEQVEGLDSIALLEDMPAKLREGSSCEYLPVHTCNVLSNQGICKHNVTLGIQRTTFKNGAVVVGIIDHRELQMETSGWWLSVFLKHLKLDHAFYMQPHGMESWAGLFLCAREWGLRTEAEYQLAKQDGDMCAKTGKKGLVTMKHHRKCVENSELFQAVNDTSRSVTIVPPWSVPPDASENDFDTQSVVKHYNCPAEPSTNHLEKQYGHLFYGKNVEWVNASHVKQCTMLQDGNGDLYAGPIMELAEKMVQIGTKANILAKADSAWQAAKEEDIIEPFPPPAPAPEEFGSGSGSGSGGEGEGEGEGGSGSGSGSGYDFEFETASEEHEFTVTPIDDTTAIVNVTGNQTMTVNVTTADDSGPVGAPGVAPMDVVGADQAPTDVDAPLPAIAPTEAVPVADPVAATDPAAAAVLEPIAVPVGGEDAAAAEQRSPFRR